MELHRLNPVTLIVGVASRFAAERARDFARRSQGGLLLADPDEALLCAIADDLEASNLSPERVSTLAFDPSDAVRWGQAEAFIDAQYGRLDWALIQVSTPPPSELVEFRTEAPLDLDALALSLSAVTAIMRKNLQGGAAIVALPAIALPSSDAAAAFENILISADAAAGDTVRINAIVLGGLQQPLWANAPLLQDLVVQAGDLRTAFDRVGAENWRAMRSTPMLGMTRLTAALLSDDCSLSCGIVAVDGDHSM
jgi:hypothetical protein